MKKQIVERHVKTYENNYLQGLKIILIEVEGHILPDSFEHDGITYYAKKIKVSIPVKPYEVLELVYIKGE